MNKNELRITPKTNQNIAHIQYFPNEDIHPESSRVSVQTALTSFIVKVVTTLVWHRSRGI